MDGGGHLFKKIQAIQNKAADRRSRRLNEARSSVYNEHIEVDKIENHHTPEQIAKARKDIKEQALKNRKRGLIQFWIKIVLTFLLTCLMCYWLIIRHL